MFFEAMRFFSCNALESVSMKNQECKTRLVIININSNEPSFYPYSVLINKYSSSCNNINNISHVSDVVKNMKIKVFNPMSKTNKTRHRIPI